MSSMLQDRVFVVAGASCGIVGEVALLCAQEGRAFVNDFGGSAEGEGGDSNPARQAENEIVAAGRRAVANLAGVWDPVGATSIIEDAAKHLGRIDASVSHAGILRDRIFPKMSEFDRHAVLETNRYGRFLVLAPGAIYFKERGSGPFVHFSSASRIGNFGRANDNAAGMGIVGLSNSIALNMERFGVRSNCIAPSASSRLTATIPAETEAGKLRVERLKTMAAAKVATLVTCLARGSAHGVTGQISAFRRNGIFLFNMRHPIRSIHCSNGWMPRTVASDLTPAFRFSLHPLERSADALCREPVQGWH